MHFFEYTFAYREHYQPVGCDSVRLTPDFTSQQRVQITANTINVSVWPRVAFNRSRSFWAISWSQNNAKWNRLPKTISICVLLIITCCWNSVSSFRSNNRVAYRLLCDCILKQYHKQVSVVTHSFFISRRLSGGWQSMLCYHRAIRIKILACKRLRLTLRLI